MTRHSRLKQFQNEASASARDGALCRTLGSMQLTMLGVGAIVGAGIFVATGIVAAQNAGPAIVLSFLLATLACLSAALCYAEFAAMMPVSGSAYSYTHAAFGPLAAWLVGWCLLLEYMMAASTLAAGWSGYLASLLADAGLTLPMQLITAPLMIVDGRLSIARPSINLPAMLITLTVTAVLMRGVRVSMTVNAILVTIKLSVIGLFVAIGAWHVDAANWQPFLPENTGTFGEYGWSGVLRGAAVIFYAYLGFDTVSTAAREARNPQQSVPRGILGSLLLCTAIYILFALVLTGLAPYPLLGTANPVATALDHASGHLGALKVVISAGALIGLTSVLMVLLYGQSRILFAMGVDGIAPSLFARVDVKSQTPARGILVCGTLAAAIAGLLPISVLGELISIGTLAAFLFVCAGVLVLRYREPDAHRPFRTPWVHFTCLSGVIVCGYLIVSLPAGTWWRFIVWMAIGCAYYGLRRPQLAARAAS
ncbi:MAG TPA: amino acid permease [Steroidobacter sp.]|nr:amino acid permease [Steroidobacter sp.]